MAAPFANANDILRRAPWTTQSEATSRALPRLLINLTGFALFYGATMGTFRLLAGEDEWLKQIFYSAVKVPLLLTCSFVIGLPSFFVLSTLLGLRRDFAESLRALVAAQAGLAIVLAAFAPLTLLWYASSTNYNSALFFNGIMFAGASLAAQYLLRGFYRPLIARNPRHRKLLIAWGAIYVAVAIQLAWLLRPFIGAPQAPVAFLRPDAWDNAYVVVARLVWRMLGL